MAMPRSGEDLPLAAGSGCGHHRRHHRADRRDRYRGRGGSPPGQARLHLIGSAYGYHRDNPRPLTEDIPARGTAQHYYSEQKAQLEKPLDETTAGSPLQVHVLRPCIVVGPRATALARAMPWNPMGQPVSGIVRSVRHAVPVARPALPDPGVAVQLVHHDDVASAISAMVVGQGPHAAALAASDLLARVPRLPWQAEWIHVARAPVVMDTSKAKQELGWRPQYTSAQALAAMAAVVGD
ncbi:MAG: hypothetical protein IPG68_06730 [Micrococcales bacterium]|nr:hypothetical protein [Micrococcales bacterium]